MVSVSVSFGGVRRGSQRQHANDSVSVNSSDERYNAAPWPQASRVVNAELGYTARSVMNRSRDARAVRGTKMYALAPQQVSDAECTYLELRMLHGPAK